MLNLTQRELIVKLFKHGKIQQEIADIVGCSQPTVNFWIRRSKNSSSLKSLPRSGRPTKLTKKSLFLLKKELFKEARLANRDFCSINTKKFSEIINSKTKNHYSIRHIRRILRKIGFSRITPRFQHVKNDPQKISEFREEFKKNSKQNTWIMKL